MTTDLLFQLAVSVVIQVFVWCGFHFAVKLAPPTTVLGVRVPRSKQRNPHVLVTRGRFYQRQTRVLIFAVLALVAVAVWGTVNQLTALSVVLPLLAVIVGLTSWISGRHHLIAIKQSENWFEGETTSVTGLVSASPRSPERTPEQRERLSPSAVSYPHPAYPWYALALLPMAASAAILALHWSEIPQTIPTHFDGSGNPDAWSDKSVGSVLMGVILAAVLVGGFFLFSAVMPRLSSRLRSDVSPAGKARTLASLSASQLGLGVMAFTLSLFVSGISVFTALPGLMEHAIIFLSAGIIGVLLVAGWMIWLVYFRTSRVDRDRRAGRYGPEPAEGLDNDEHYKWGLFYCNPDDPAVLVEKRSGVGMDFNYARWQGQAFLVVIVTMIVAVIGIPLLFG